MLISFGAINILAFANPSEGSIELVNPNLSIEAQYLIGILMSLITVLACSAFNLSTRFMKDTSAMIIQIPYNSFSAIVFALIILYQYVSQGVVPLTSLTGATPIMLLLLSSVFNFAGQACNVMAYQRANPALVSLLGYSQVIYNLLGDMIIFHVVPNRLQTIAILILLTANITYFTTKLYYDKLEEAKQRKKLYLLKLGGITNSNEDSFTRV